jgi:hypothetical protein
MNLGELKGLIIGLPDTAKVYVESDHGQNPEGGSGIQVTDTLEELPFYWEKLGEDWKDTDEVLPCNVTAILVW